MVTTPRNKTDQTVSALAKAYLAETNDVQEATARLVEHLHDDLALYRNAMDSLVTARAYDLIREVCRKERRAIWTAPNYDAAGKGDRVHTAVKHSLLDMRLPNGMKLSEARKSDLLDAQGFYQRQADTMSHIARWLGAVADEVGGKKVGDVLTDANLREMQGMMK